MADLLANFLRITASMSLLAVLILLGTPLLKKRYTARWRYWVWLAIAVRLLIPIRIPAIELPDFGEILGESVPFFEDVQLPDQVQTASSQTEKDPVRPSAMIQQAGISPAYQAMMLPPSQEEQLRAERTAFWQEWWGKVQAFPWMKVGSILWVAGAAAMLIFYGVSYIHMRRVLKLHMRPVQNAACWEVWKKICAQTGYRGPLRLMRCQAVASPVVCGLWSPVLLLPHEDYPTPVLEMIFRHELVHIMRCDLWYKLLLLAASAVHWFNPVVHWMVRAADRDLEISCDEQVIARQGRDFRAQYSEAIFGVLRQSVKQRKFLFSTSFCDEKKTLMQRFSAIFDTSRKRHGVLLMSFVLAVCLLTGSLIGCRVSPAEPGGEPKETITPSGQELNLGRDALEQMRRTARLYESYCCGLERAENLEPAYFTSLGFGYLLEDDQLKVSEHQDYSIEAKTLAQIDQFFFCGVWADWDNEYQQEIYHFAIDYQTTGEEFFALEQTDVRQLENGDVAVDYQRKTDKALLRPVRYVFRPQRVDLVPDSLKGAFSVGDTVYKIASVTNLEVEPPRSQVIEIANAEQLLEAAKRINEGGWLNQNDTYRLTADIDLTGVDFVPMGMNERYLSHWDRDDARDPSLRGFNGLFDGQGHTISHLRLDASGLEYLGDPNYALNGVGFFSLIGSNGQVKNLKLEDCVVTSPMEYGTDWGATGLLAAQCSGQVQNVSVQGTVEGSYYVGGLAGSIGGTAYDCSADVTVRGYNSVGAFAGESSYAIMQNCTATGQVVSMPVRGASAGDAVPTSIGGFTGFSVGGTALNCDVSVYVSTTVSSNWVGAFGGYVQSFRAENCTYDAEKAGNWEILDVVYQPSGDLVDIRAK